MTDNNKDLESLVIQDLLGNKDRREMIHGILRATGIFDGAFDCDPYVHARNAGRQSVGHDLAAKLQHAAPNSYMKMLEENLVD